MLALPIVSDMLRFRIRTNWTNSVNKTHEFGLDDLTDHLSEFPMRKRFSS